MIERAEPDDRIATHLGDLEAEDMARFARCHLGMIRSQRNFGVDADMYDSFAEQHMEFVTLPQALFVFYGGLVLSCGIALGVVVGRNWKRRPPAGAPEPPELLQNRVALLEQELDITSAELRRLTDDRAFMRELRPPRDSAAAA
jgi:hypothetical protein